MCLLIFRRCGGGGILKSVFSTISFLLLKKQTAQHVVTYPASKHPPGSTLRCTYITIPQAPHTHAIILSKPPWMWGAEMAANDAGLVIGNEAVWTLEPDDGPEALLGMDLVRLAAERCSTAAAAVGTIAALLDAHGQGGGCEEGGSEWSYHNSFLIADREEAWVMETAGEWWVAEKIVSGVRNISNCLSIRTEFDNSSAGIREYAQKAGYWDGSGVFDWAAVFSSSGAVPPRGEKSSGREANGYALLLERSSASEFSVGDMMDILRNRKSGVCMCGGGFRSNGSQVSVLCNSNSTQKKGAAVDVHWFTGTPDPSKSCFKPITFPLADALTEEMAADLWNGADRAQGLSSKEKTEQMQRLEEEAMTADERSEVSGIEVYVSLLKKEIEMYTQT